MEIVAYIWSKGSKIAEVVYRTGFHVEVHVADDFQSLSVSLDLRHSENGRLQGSWEDALDAYFNEGTFDSKEAIFPGELRRVGSAREHKSLFRQAIRALAKDL
jgi:hypothetical protein